jgi:hypothetical protein
VPAGSLGRLRRCAISVLIPPVGHRPALSQSSSNLRMTLPRPNSSWCFHVPGRVCQQTALTLLNHDQPVLSDLEAKKKCGTVPRQAHPGRYLIAWARKEIAALSVLCCPRQRRTASSGRDGRSEPLSCHYLQCRQRGDSLDANDAVQAVSLDSLRRVAQQRRRCLRVVIHVQQIFWAMEVYHGRPPDGYAAEGQGGPSISRPVPPCTNPTFPQYELQVVKVVFDLT